MKTLASKLIIFLVLVVFVGCNNNNENIITIKKSIIPLNNSNISRTISFTQKNDSVHLYLLTAIKKNELSQSPCVDNNYGAHIVVSARA